jgi:CheY-like chemotaxis protein
MYEIFVLFRKLRLLTSIHIFFAFGTLFAVPSSRWSVIVGEHWKPINQVLREFHQKSASSVTPALRLAPELDEITFDPVQLQRILFAVLENAALFPQDTPLVLQASVIDSNHHLGCGVDGGCLVISLGRETLPSGCIDHVPDNTYSGLQSFQSLARLISSIHGTILVCESAGRLSRLRCVLPIALRDHEQQHRIRETILLVEDEEFVRNVTSEVLQISGYEVYEAIDAESGIRLFQKHRGGIDLLLTDVVMPGMNGHDLAKNLLAASPRLKVIFMSGYTENAITREGLADPRLVYLQKPFTLDVLTRKVREVLDDALPANLNFAPAAIAACSGDQA